MKRKIWMQTKSQNALNAFFTCQNGYSQLYSHSLNFTAIVFRPIKFSYGNDEKLMQLTQRKLVLVIKKKTELNCDKKKWFQIVFVLFFFLWNSLLVFLKLMISYAARWFIFIDVANMRTKNRNSQFIKRATRKIRKWN